MSAGAVDDEQFTVCVSAANNTHMGIIRVKHQVAGLSVLPTDIGTIAVLHGSSSTVADDVAAAGLIVEHPINESRTVQPVGAIGSRGGAARRCDLPQLAPSGVPANHKALAAPKIIHLTDKRTGGAYHRLTLW